MVISTYIIDLKSGPTNWIEMLYRDFESLDLQELLVLSHETVAYIFCVSISGHGDLFKLEEYLNKKIDRKRFKIKETLVQTESLIFFLQLMTGMVDTNREIIETITHIKESFNLAMVHNVTGPVLGKLYRMGLDFSQKMYNRPELQSISTTIGDAIYDIARKISDDINDFQILLCSRNDYNLAQLIQVFKRHNINRIFHFTDNMRESYETSLDSGCLPVDQNRFSSLLKKNTVIINANIDNSYLWDFLFTPLSQNRNALYIYFQLDNSAVPKKTHKMSNIFIQKSDHITGVIDLHRKKRIELLGVFKHEIEHEIEKFNDWLHSEKRFEYSGIVSRNRQMQKIFELMRRIAPVDISVLIIGDTGTGKELIARAIHNNSKRREKKFVAVNCSAFPETLLEAELFGYEKGAFTGAVMAKKGLVEIASGGTLFLDEIGEIPLPIQVKLLRVLQEREILRLGNPEPISVDVRLIAASNRDITQLIKEGRFRSDLFYRVNTVQIQLPSLTERPEDILLLARHFIDKLNKLHNRNVLTFNDEVREILQAYSWPGNVRELENVIEHAIAVSVGEHLTRTDLPVQLTAGASKTVPAEPTLLTLKDIEATHIKDLLFQQNYNYGKVAELLGISRTTLWRKMKEYGLSR